MDRWFFFLFCSLSLFCLFAPSGEGRADGCSLTYQIGICLNIYVREQQRTDRLRERTDRSVRVVASER